jgi:transposase
MWSRCWCPNSAPATSLVVDNLSSHKGPAVCQAIAEVGALLLYLPSSDFNPTENAFAKLKALLPKAAEPTAMASGRHRSHHRPLRASECANYFAAAGYEPDPL